eukprot:scaffold14782_cov174-Amphora_coffeaeformis.AAC.11
MVGKKTVPGSCREIVLSLVVDQARPVVVVCDRRASPTNHSPRVALVENCEPIEIKRDAQARQYLKVLSILLYYDTPQNEILFLLRKLVPVLVRCGMVPYTIVGMKLRGARSRGLLFSSAGANIITKNHHHHPCREKVKMYGTSTLQPLLPPLSILVDETLSKLDSLLAIQVCKHNHGPLRLVGRMSRCTIQLTW